MTWTLLAIRELGDGMDGVRYPVPTSDRNGIVLDDWDGCCAPVVTATRIELQELVGDSTKPETILRAESVKVSIYITESRVAIACSKYDKGGGWVGGATALAFNAVSKARAAIRSQGKCLVGQVRYPWLSAVGFSPKTGWLSDETLRLVAVERSGGVETKYLLDLTLPKSISAEKMAREIAQRAARFRLARTSMDSEKERARMEALLDPPVLQPDKGRFALWSFGTYYFARESTAFGDVDGSGTHDAGGHVAPLAELPPPEPSQRIAPAAPTGPGGLIPIADAVPADAVAVPGWGSTGAPAQEVPWWQS